MAYLDQFLSVIVKHSGSDLHFAEGCKHMVPWDAAELFHRLAVPFLTR